MADCDSMSDSSGDEDYVPEGCSESEGVCGSASEEEGEERSRVALEGERRAGKKSKQGRRHKGGGPTVSQLTEEARQIEEEEREKMEKQKEKRIDDLWSSFKQDVSAKAPTPVAVETSSSSQVKTTAPLQAAGKIMTVIKTYDFAGEDVKVSTEVAVDSKEGKRLLLEQSLGSGSADGANVNRPAEVEQANQEGGKGTASSLGTKRGSGLSSVLAQISKKPKMSTLTKSKFDWDSYKKTEGLNDELTQGTKDGYLERKAFLERVDWREFELERQERSKHFKRLT